MPGRRAILSLIFALVFLKISRTEGKYLKNTGVLPTTGNNLPNDVPTVKLKSTPLETAAPPAAQEGFTGTQSSVSLQGGEGGVGTTANATIQKVVNPGLTKSSGLQYWHYIVIGIAALAVLVVALIVFYSKFIKWKDHGSYMVWDETDETSPAFTRESEFLLDTLTADPDLASSELQQYEIPLDSISYTQVYVSSTKKVAPKRPSKDDGRREKTQKEAKKKDGQFNIPSLTKFTKRGTVYNSVTDTCMTSIMSEGTLNGDMTISGNTLEMLSNSRLDKYGSLRNVSSAFPHFDSISPKDTLKLYNMGNRTKSTSNLLHVRPLPAVPISKRFSKSLDKLRLFHTLPEIRPKKGQKRPLPDLPLNPPPIVKSASVGCHVNRIIDNNNETSPKVSHFGHILGQRKMSLDVQPKSPPEGVGRSLLSSRFSKSLDTLLLLRNVEKIPIDIDIYHSYESVHGRGGVDVEYASVLDSNPSSPVSESGSFKSTPEQHGSSVGDQEEGNVYASVSEDDADSETDSKGSALPLPGNPPPLGNPPPSDDTLERGEFPFERTLTMSSTSSVATSPYACIRISQIPGLTTLERVHEKDGNNSTAENSGNSTETPENSGSTVGTAELKPGVNSARSSTHTYLELFPDENCRDSVISETSSGYARPVDLVSEIDKKNETLESRKSLTDVEIPIEIRQPFEEAEPKRTRSSNSKGYDNPVNISDEEEKHTNDDYYIDMGSSKKAEHIYENSEIGHNRVIYENTDVVLEGLNSQKQRNENEIKMRPSFQIGGEPEDETIV